MKRGRKAKDPYDILDDEFKSQMQAASREELELKIAAVAMAQSELLKAKKEDGDLKERQDAVACAMLPYRDGSKQNLTKIRFMKQLLDDAGGPIHAF